MPPVCSSIASITSPSSISTVYGAIKRLSKRTLSRSSINKRTFFGRRVGVYSGPVKKKANCPNLNTLFFTIYIKNLKDKIGKCCIIASTQIKNTNQSKKEVC